ncbi:dTMP kinase [Spongiibacter sp. KMU-158]|uniref:Thymidylate kinase n=1 Tax=Spongiibacter pelagi TaxID=2760804 RepID=A0A927C452_9GAMM|nr:dTMP kinase [Spongiibacter pelagi]MBD2859672.1 dTMP kinase [Spongiibacter pelagi]
MTKRGVFLTVEGGEGVGKSTNLAFLTERLKAAGIPFISTREPGGTELAEQIRSLLLTPREEAMSELTELLLVFAARAQHLEACIKPAIEQGQWVVCDRFTDATYAYQGGGRGLSQSTIAQLESLVQGELRPDYTILLDAPVAVGMSRARERGELDRFEREQQSFFEKVRGAYLHMAAEHAKRYRVIDASVELEAVQQQLGGEIDSIIEAWLA